MASIVIFVVVLAKDLAFDIHSYLFSRDGLDIRNICKKNK